MIKDTYRYQIQPLPIASIPGGDGISASSYGNNVPIGQAVSFPTSTPPPPIGVVSGGGGGGSLPTVDLELCDTTIVRVYGFVV